jgi:hypothetical protein
VISNLKIMALREAGSCLHLVRHDGPCPVWASSAWLMDAVRVQMEPRGWEHHKLTESVVYAIHLMPLCT